jgi:hypothetical protein
VLSSLCLQVMKKAEKMMSSSVLKFPVHVEAQIRDSCMTSPEEIVVMLTEILQSSCPVFHNGELDLARTENIGDFCESVAVSDMEEGQFVSFWQADLSVHAYRLTEEEPVVIYLMISWISVVALSLSDQELLSVVL